MKKVSGFSVIIPVYNEEDAVITVIEDVLKAAKEWGVPVQAVVVNDGSTDKTEERIISKFSGNPEVLLVSHKKNRGVGIARNTGIEHSVYEIVGMIDADETYPAEAIPELVEKMLEYDMVVGARNIEKGGMWFLRRAAKDFIRLLASYLFDTKIPDLNSGLRFFKKELALRYFYLLPPGHSWVSTITLAFLADGYSVCFHPIKYYPRLKGKSSFHPILDTYNYLLLVLRACTYFRPLKIFAPLFIALFLFGIAKSVVDITHNRGIQESDIIIIIAAILILVLGLLCDLIVMEGKKKFPASRQ